MIIKKAVIPVAGKGTRFLPATKETPKEILPIINVPMIHYVVDEAVRSGIEQIIFVTSSGKSAVENYFDRNLELETFLEKNGKHELLRTIQKIGDMVEVVSVRQKEQLGLGHAIMQAQNIIGSDNFAVLLGDDIIVSEVPCTKQLIDVSEKCSLASVIGVMEVAREDTSNYGIVDGKFIEGSNKTLKMERMVEKPEPEEAPSNLATPGRYILSSNVFDILREIPRGAGGEYQLTDAINVMAGKERVYAHIFEGERFDTGSIRGYLDATIEFALRDPEKKEVMQEIIAEKVKRHGIKV